MKLKKLAAVGLVGVMLAGLTACGGNSEKANAKTADGKVKEKLVIWSWGADEAVSYTHLDVYKRQIIHCLLIRVS